MTQKSPMKLVDSVFDLDQRQAEKWEYIRALQKFRDMEAEIDEAIDLAKLRINQFESGDIKR